MVADLVVAELVVVAARAELLDVGRVAWHVAQEHDTRR